MNKTPNPLSMAREILAIESEAKALTERAQAARAELARLMAATGAKRLDGYGLAVSLASAPTRVQVADLEALPEQYRRLEWCADNAAIRHAFQQGETIPGAQVTQGAPIVRIKAETQPDES
jgi:hypothetical protein